MQQITRVIFSLLFSNEFVNILATNQQKTNKKLQTLFVEKYPLILRKRTGYYFNP